MNMLVAMEFYFLRTAPFVGVMYGAFMRQSINTFICLIIRHIFGLVPIYQAPKILNLLPEERGRLLEL